MSSGSESVFARYFYPVAFAGVGVATVVITNIVSRRPAISGIQKHIISLGTGAVLGEMFYNRQKRITAERDAVIRHYIQLHPEDFPELEPKKYKEIFEPWLPIR
ncbi:NADH dehydrogenase [ubiquinone] 1 subunit C2-like [Limulus polyphemus]|uniref:NADH dehydrogenase [ubiquinone] 1 subunit C2 n=1 Tax=Limulus polyphemus TaxID=6850 RepID=A0ABM1BFF8_LIMPO|nr:NADH dehydrogenase [ubiquinone] 1 subunit C2-like [Limulus polyphemus]